jgi:phage terminase large subunit
VSAASRIRTWREHPDIFVREVFGATPDAWQDEVLKAFPGNQRQALKACKGPGKTCVLAWLAWNFLLTRPHPKIAATSITSDTLSDTLWSEMAMWQNKSELLKATFVWQKTRIFAKDHPETWWMSARSWSKTADANQQGNTLAGLHADYILFLLDEAGGIPDAVMAAAEAALSSCVEGHLLIAGNPTHLTGPLYRACTTERRLWWIKEITSDPDDPSRTPRVSIQWAKEQIEKYGKDNPWVLVNVFGRFPPSSLNTLIGPDEVQEAMKRYWRTHEIGKSPKVMGVDVARYGDDSSVLCKRQGIQVFPFGQRRNLDSTQGAGWISREMVDWGADACFVDDSGGFGSGWIDQMRQLGHPPIGINFANKAHDAERYANKRAEMYFDAVEWIRRGGALPDCPELTAALTQTTYTFQGNRLLLEPKDQVKVKIGYSPDHADSFVLTFSEPVSIKAIAPGRARFQAEYDPFADFGKSVEQSYR